MMFGPNVIVDDLIDRIGRHSVACDADGLTDFHTGAVYRPVRRKVNEERRVDNRSSATLHSNDRSQKEPPACISIRPWPHRPRFKGPDPSWAVTGIPLLRSRSGSPRTPAPRRAKLMKRFWSWRSAIRWLIRFRPFAFTSPGNRSPKKPSPATFTREAGCVNGIWPFLKERTLWTSPMWPSCMNRFGPGWDCKKRKTYRPNFARTPRRAAINPEALCRN